MKRISKFSQALVWLMAMTQVVLPAHAAISNLPPMVKAGVPPNVFFTLDDSGSMMFEILPEMIGPVGNASDRITAGGRTWTRTSISSDYCSPALTCWVIYTFPQPLNVYNINGRGNYGGRNAGVVGFNDNITVARLRTATLNTAYYDPSVRYIPWIDPSTITATNPYGTPMANAVPTAARWNPVAPTGGNNDPTIDLTANATMTATWLNDAAFDVASAERTFYPATYYVYKPRPTYNPAVDGACTQSTLNCFTRIQIIEGTNFGTKATGRSDCSGTSCTYNEEMQNFANWFQYYRSRINIARAGAGQAFAKQSAGMRVGFGTINTTGTRIQSVGNDFSAPEKASFLNTYYQQPIPTAGTPLRKAMDEVGQYFMDKTITGPWQTQSGVGLATDQISCRQNFNILMTDGYWNGTAAVAPRNANVDGANGTSKTRPDGTTYTYVAGPPYSDTQADTLADVAMYYWVNDLRPDWPAAKKNVPISKDGVDIAFWQHLVQYTVGLGVVGSLNPTTDLPRLTNGTLAWPTASTNQVDDLWHAAVNSRGKYFSAANPTQFADALNQSLNEISARAGDAAAVATSNTILGANTKVYTSTYMTGDWSGRLEQKTLNPVTGDIASTDWNSDTGIPAAASRVIVSSNPTNGVGGTDFLYTQLNNAQKQIFNNAAALYPLPNTVTGTDLVNYIRGDQSKESKPFRTRKLLLGDLVNSDPQYVKEGRNGGYNSLPIGALGQSSYLTYYRNNLANRSATVYVGSNDGMLHAFNASEDLNKGKERFAFIPQEVIANLPELAKPSYVHRFYADATPMIADAALGSSSTPWRTVLVSGLGAGGRSWFALDVTDPTNFTKTNVMWERSASVPTVDSDIGYTFGVPQVGRMRDGRWVAIAGNGYVSASGKAVLYVMDLATGSVLFKLDTGRGSVGSPNGLSTPKILYNSDATINSVYAGDLQGNVWEFNFVDSGSPIVTRPQTANSGAPLFQSGRPITVQPQVYPHPQGGFMVIFGTGKIFENTDPTTTTLENLYGVWDKGDNIAVTPSQLVTQGLSLFNTIYYKVSSNTIDWTTKRGWVTPMNIKAGERLITDPNVFEGQVIFTTIVPNTSTDPCALDGLTTTLQLNPLTGGALSFPTIDTNGDGVVNRNDTIVSGKQTSSTFGTTIVKIGNGNWKVFQVPSGGSGGTPGLNNGDLRKGMDSIPTVRLWRQILNAQ